MWFKVGGTRARASRRLNLELCLAAALLRLTHGVWDAAELVICQRGNARWKVNKEERCPLFEGDLPSFSQVANALAGDPVCELPFDQTI